MTESKSIDKHSHFQIAKALVQQYGVDHRVAFTIAFGYLNGQLPSAEKFPANKIMKGIENASDVPSITIEEFDQILRKFSISEPAKDERAK